MIVKYNDNDAGPLFGRHGKLAQAHQESAISSESNDRPVGFVKACGDRGGQRERHCCQSIGNQNVVGFGTGPKRHGREHVSAGIDSYARHGCKRSRGFHCQFNNLLYVDGGVSGTQTAGVVKMEGQEVFKHAVAKLAESGEAALAKTGLTSDDVTWIVPHQANLRIIKRTAQKMGVPLDRVVITVQDHGNTSAASIPLALSVGWQRGQIKENDLLLTEAIGGGLAWGAAVLRW